MAILSCMATTAGTPAATRRGASPRKASAGLREAVWQLAKKTIFKNFKHIIVVEMNDYGAYGYGQLAMLLRARLADPKIKSVCKTDGLAFRVREIVTGVEKHLAGK